MSWTGPFALSLYINDRSNVSDLSHAFSVLEKKMCNLMKISDERVSILDRGVILGRGKSILSPEVVREWGKSRDSRDLRDFPHGEDMV